MLRIIDLRAVTEFVAVLIRLLRFFVSERDGINTELGESVQLRRFGDSIVIRVLPQSQRIEDRIIRVDHSVAIAAVCRLVIFRQRKKAVFLKPRRGLRLRSEVAKELSAVIHSAVAVSIKREPSIIRARNRPGQFLFRAIAVKIEVCIGAVGVSSNAPRRQFSV